MITIKVKEKEELTACDINDLEALLDNENSKVVILYRGIELGEYERICGMSEDDFISAIKYKETC